MTSSLLAGLTIALTASTARAGKTCVVTGTDVSISKVTIAARSGPFEIRVAHVAATVTVTGRTAKVEVAGMVGFKGVVTQKIWYQLTRGFTVDQVTLTPGANFVGDRAVGDQMFGSAVLHASDVMEGEDKPPDEAASQIAVHCADLSLDWSGDRTDAALASTGTTYLTRTASSLLLHREPEDGAAGVTVATSCEGEGCLFFESIARRGDWIELGVANEGVAVVGWVRASTVKRAPASLGLGFTYGCTGDHGGGTVMYGDPPTMKHHTVRLDRGVAIYAAADGEVWANVLQAFEIDVVYAAGDRWAEIRALPGIDLGATPAYVPVSSLRAPAH